MYIIMGGGGGCKTEKIRRSKFPKFRIRIFFSLQSIFGVFQPLKFFTIRCCQCFILVCHLLIRKINPFLLFGRQLDKMQYIHIAEVGCLPFVITHHYVMLAHLQSLCYCMVNQYLKNWHMRRGVANNMHPLCLGSSNGIDPKMIQISKMVYQKSLPRNEKG